MKIKGRVAHVGVITTGVSQRTGNKWKSQEIVIEYFDDEELDRFRGMASDEYDDEAVEEFREVLYTMDPREVDDWLKSLELREVALPDALKDEVFMLLR